VPPVNEIVLGAVVVTMPPHTAVGPELATVIPAGKVSVNATPVRLTAAFGLVSVKVSVVVPFSKTLELPNALLMVGAATTVIIAVAMFPVPPFVEGDETGDAPNHTDEAVPLPENTEGFGRRRSRGKEPDPTI